MTVESEIIEIVRAHNLKHVSAVLRDDGSVSVSVFVSKPPRVKGFDPSEYYRNNRERIRKYQADYYLRTKGKKEHRIESGTFKPVEDNNGMIESLADPVEVAQERISGEEVDFSFSGSPEANIPVGAVQEPSLRDDEDFSLIHFSGTTPSVVTHDQLAAAMAYCYSQQGRKVNEEEFLETATGILQFFGYGSEVVENHLEEGDRQVMYQLEDIDLVSTRAEETSLVIDGKPWRTHYFVLNIRKIKEYAAKEVEEKDGFAEVYGSLPEEAWAR
jgi:hypothetical protein